MKPGLKPLILGIILFLLGAFALPLVFIFLLIRHDSAEQRFLVPGSQDITVEEPGRYYLWHDYQTIHNGKSFNKPENIPDGLEIMVSNMDGTPIPFTASFSMSSNNGRAAKRTIGYVDLSEPSKLTVSVTGNSEKRVFSFSKAIFKSLLASILGVGFLSMVIIFTGLGITLWGIVRLANNHPSEHR